MYIIKHPKGDFVKIPDSEDRRRYCAYKFPNISGPGEITLIWENGNAGLKILNCEREGNVWVSRIPLGLMEGSIIDELDESSPEHKALDLLLQG